MPINVLTTSENKKKIIKKTGDAGNFRSEISKSENFHIF